MTNMNAMGWWSGSDHVHMNYGGNLNNTPEYMLFEAKAEDLDHIGWKIANKDNRVFDTQYYKGEPLHPLSDDQNLISFGEEYRPAWYGHINFINLTKHLVSPFTTAYEDTGIASLYPSNTDMFRLARKQGWEPRTDGSTHGSHSSCVGGDAHSRRSAVVALSRPVH